MEVEWGEVMVIPEGHVYCLRTCMYVHVCTCVCVFVCISMTVCICVCVHVHNYIHMCVICVCGQVIDPEKSTIDISGTKVEVKLRKASPVMWPCLELVEKRTAPKEEGSD